MIIDNKSKFLYEVFENKNTQELQILTPFITLYGFEVIEKIIGVNEELKYKNQLKQMKVY